MTVEYLPLVAWHLIEKTAIQHPPKITEAVLGFFGVYALIQGLKSGRWISAIILSAVMTAILVFAAACLYTFYTHPGFRLFDLHRLGIHW